MRVPFSFRTCSIVVALVFAIGGGDPAIANEGKPPESPKPLDPITVAFSKHSKQSATRLDHRMWSTFLTRTVVFAGYSIERIGKGEKQKWVDSKMGYGNDSQSRYENNRIAMGSLEKEHFVAIETYRTWLENLPKEIEFGTLSMNEQLAYWLNLYNVRALEIVADHYPATTTKKLRSAPGKRPKGAWYEKTLNVAGMPLSLVDIEQKILFPIWDHPLVMYGLWQGAIGGPRLPLRAYTANNVWEVLRDNAYEFVNSNRGARPQGRTLKVSQMYAWASPLFDGEDDLHDHLKTWMNKPFSRGVEQTTRIKYALYDWYLADMSGGSHHRGQRNQVAGMIAGMEGAVSDSNTGGAVPTANFAGGTFNQAIGNFAMRNSTGMLRNSPLTMNLVRNMKRYNYNDRRPYITVEDCPEDGCVSPNIGDAMSDAANPNDQVLND